MKDNLSTIKEKGMAPSAGLMDVSTLVNGKLENNMEKEPTSVSIIKENPVFGKMARKFNG